MFGHFLLRGYSVGRRFSSVGRSLKKVAAVGGGHGAGLGRNELAACRVKRATLEYGGQSLHSRFDDGWRGAQARLVHSSAGNGTMKSSAGQSRLLVGKENFEELRRELQAMDLSDRVSCIVDMADAYFQKRGRVDARIVDQFRDDVVEEVLADFRWSSLEVLANIKSANHVSHILARFDKQPSAAAAVDRLVERAAVELFADSTGAAASVQNASTVISMLLYVRRASSELLEKINAVEALVVDAVHEVQDARTCFGLLQVFTDKVKNQLPIFCSVPILNAVYDRLTELLPAMKDDPRSKLHRRSLHVSICVCRGRVLHRRFLAAWGRHMLWLLRNKHLRFNIADLNKSLQVFAYFNHPCSPLVNTVLGRLEAGQYAPFSVRLDLLIILLHKLLMLNVELPRPVVHHVVSRLDPHTLTQLPETVLNYLEQLLFSLPLSDGLFLNLLQFMQRVPYYNQMIADHFARQKMSSAAWQHVILDAALPGGRVPVICMLSCMEKKTVVQWPEWLKPFAVWKENVGKLSGIPVALLVPRMHNILHAPADAVAAETRFQKESLEQQGYKVFCIASKKEVEAAKRCSSIGELMEVAVKL